MTQPNSHSLLSSPFGLAGCTVIAFFSTLALACDIGETSGGNDASGGSLSSGGSVATGGNSATGGALSAGGAAAASGGTNVAGGSSGPSGFGTPTQERSGTASDRWAQTDVKRNGKNYYFMSNGWGPGFGSQSVSWLGTSFAVTAMQGVQGPMYQPASYPTVFCGVYSLSSSGECGLPRALNQISSLWTGWRWQPNGNTGQYNAAYDIWLSTSASVSGHSSFLMVWYRDPPGQQPNGGVRHSNITVAGVPGSWNLWVGSVENKPYVAYVRAEGQDIYELEFDAMAFVRDVASRGISLPGSHILSVAVGFEIWNGPVANLVSQDFYVDVK